MRNVCVSLAVKGAIVVPFTAWPHVSGNITHPYEGQVTMQKRSPPSMQDKVMFKCLSRGIVRHPQTFATNNYCNNVQVEFTSL